MTSRRTFLSGALALTTVALAGRSTGAADKPTITVHRSPT